MKIEYIDELLNKIGFNTYVLNENEIEIEFDNEFEIKEILNNSGISEIKKIENIDDEFIIVEFEFSNKNKIESYDDLMKYINQNKSYEFLIDNPEYNEIYENSICTNEINDYLMKFHYNHKNYFDIEFDNDYYDENEIELIYKLKYVLNENFIDDIEIYESIDEFIESYDDYEYIIKDYHIVIDDENNIIVDHDKKMIVNIYDCYDFSRNVINKYLTENNNKIIHHDELIEIINIIDDEIKIISYNSNLYLVRINKLYFENEIGLNEMIDDIDENIIKFNDISKIDYIDYIVEISYDEIDNYFDYDELNEFIINNVELSYDYYEFENYKKLSNLFYKLENKKNKGMI